MCTIPKAIAIAFMLFLSAESLTAWAQTNVTQRKLERFAKEAYIYGYPMVDSYSHSIRLFCGSDESGVQVTVE